MKAIKEIILILIVVTAAIYCMEKSYNGGRTDGYKIGLDKGFDLAADTINKILEKHAKCDTIVGELTIESKDTITYYISKRVVL